jgi:hypothetical protein
MSKTIIAIKSDKLGNSAFRDLHEGEQRTAKAVLALHEQSRATGITNAVGVIVYAAINGDGMTEFSAFATPDAPNALATALAAAAAAGTSTKTTIAISVSDNMTAELEDDDAVSFLEANGKAVLFVSSTDRSVTIASYEGITD